MISSDVHPPPDPCSSSDHHNQQKFHVFKISCDDKAHASVTDIDLLKSLVADLNDTNNPQPNFSIRDYVFNSRSKDIACNWPFSHKTLQICLKHGVKNLLPPFQSLEKLRNNSSNEEIISSCDGKSNLELILESKTSKKSQTYLQEDSGQTKSKKVVIDSSRKTETAIKKCRIVGVEPIKEVTPMAAKVCPVCKTFSSSSNTTLNAHIDRCLSGESSMKWTANPKVVVKHRIKPRMTRLMVDIYKTAPHCTVEELDARNGSSWANNSSFPSQELEFQGKEQCRETTIVPEVPDHEGDVYIDTNGTKVRILSVPKVDIPDDHGVQTSLKAGKSSKYFIGKKKKKDHELKHQHKYLEASPHSKKLKPFSEVRNGREENVAIKESCNKEDRGKEAMNKDDLPIVRPPWACSKRTVLVKKSQHSRQNANKNLSIASDKPFSGCAPSSSANTKGFLSQQNSQKMGTFSMYKEQFAKKRSPLLTEPTSKQLKKKKGTLSRNSSEDPLDLKSRGSKLSSSGKTLLPVSREPASKLNLKRKISAIKQSCVGTSEDSVKQKPRVEEETSGKIASESTILLDVRKNVKAKIFRPENSVASKSLNGDSSTWMKTDCVNPSCDVESYTKKPLSLDEPVSTEFPKMVSEPGNMFDSREHDDDKKMYIADVNQQHMRIDDVTDDIERQQNYFREVDTIQLTKPPGLFLSSHDRDMVSEKLQGSSSMATLSRVHSSEEQHYHDMMDRDSMSDSPISTISNPSLARSDSDKFSPITSGNWRSMRTTSFKNDQPCCCSRKEIASNQTVASSIPESTLLKKHAIESFNFRPHMYSAAAVVPEAVQAASPAMKFPAYSECDSVSSPSKPVLRLMGKNLTVVNTDDYENVPQISPMGQFPNVSNEYKISSIGQNGFKSQHLTSHPPNNATNHALDTMFRSTTYADYFKSHMSPMIPQASASQDRRTGFDGHVISEMNMHNAPPKPVKEIIIIDDSPENGLNHMHSGYQSQLSLAYNNSSFQGYSAFMNVENNGNLDKWNCTPTGSSRSSSIYYRPI